jgi:putative PIN family toxin of toxin-antitoxin system
MRVMLDTNVLISAIVFRSAIMNGIIKALAVKHKLVLCSYTMEELCEVIEHKFPAARIHIDTFFSSLPFEHFDTPKPIPKHDLFKIRDVDDEPVLYSAIIANVDILITGDKDFLDIDVKHPEIMTPSEFLHKYY